MQRKHEEQIKKVENNLHSPIQLAGEPGKSIQDRMRVHNVPDVSISVFDSSGIWTQSYTKSSDGQLSKIPGPVLFQAASISKTINAILAIKLLVETGKIGLDEDVNLYLKDWKIPGDKFKEKVTLRRLLSHTAGLNVSGFPGYPSSQTIFPTTVDVLKGNEALRNISLEEQEKLLVSIPEGKVRTPPVEIINEPGSAMAYSGGGTTVIQKLIEDISGEPYPALAKKYILDPLGMTASSFEFKFPGTANDNVKRGHSPDGKEVLGGWHIYPELAAAGLWTTSEDLAKFFTAIQKAYRSEENVLLSQEIAKMMLTKQPNSSYGLGFFIDDYKGELAFGHSGGNEGFNCDAIVLPNRETGVVVMTNSDRGFRLINELMCSVFEVYGLPGKPYKEKKSMVPDPGILDRCCGVFALTLKQGTGNIIVTKENNKLLVAIPSPHVTSDTKLNIALTPESNTVFFNGDEDLEITFNNNYTKINFWGMEATRVQPTLIDSTTTKIAKELGFVPAPICKTPSAQQSTAAPIPLSEPVLKDGAVQTRSTKRM